MNAKRYFLKMDLHKGVFNQPYIEFVTGDNSGYEIQFQIINGDSTNYDLTNCIVRLMSVKDKSHQQDCELLLPETGIGTVKLLQDMYSSPGEYWAEFQIYKKDDQTKRLSTPRFKYHVRGSLQDDSTVEAENSFSIVQKMYDDVVKSKTMADQAFQTATNAHNLATQQIDAINSASQNANQALDRASDIVTQTDLRNHIKVCDNAQQATIGQLLFVRISQ